MIDTLSTRPCAADGCDKFAQVGEQLCDEHLIKAWIDEYCRRIGNDAQPKQDDHERQS